jgi:hypothetical protein
MAHSPSALMNLDRGSIGDPEAVLEFALDAHAGEHLADLRAAAVHDDRIDAG